MFSRLTAIVLFIFLCIDIYPQENNYELNEVVVTAANTPVYFKDLARTVIVISAAELKSIPADNLNDILSYSLGIDLHSRGTEGVQADAGIRGGTFEQTLILVDGIPMSDPQTGHHNLNIPVPVDHIERIEILKGHGSNIYGPNAFSGAINFITKKGTDRDFSARVSGGTHSLFDAGFSISQPLWKSGNRLSFSRKTSDGYRHNTDFKNTTAAFSTGIELGEFNRLNILLGFNDKDFGANSFYSDKFPDQREHTTTKLLSISNFGNYGSFNLETKIYIRTNKDEFWLNYKNPSFYYNLHNSNTVGAEIKSSFKSAAGQTSIGGEFSKDKIESSNLGDHSREKYGAFVEQSFQLFEKVKIIAGGFAYNYAETGWKFWPGIDLNFALNNSASIYFNAGKAFRIPTFTELYYKDSATEGSPNLNYEETFNWEAGIKYSVKGILLSGDVFMKDGKNLIDYFRTDPAMKWQAMNIAELKTTGFEVSAKLNFQEYNIPFLQSASFEYAHLIGDRQISGGESRYAYNFLKDQAVITLLHKLFFDIETNWVFRYEERLNQPSRFLTDIKLMRTFGQFTANISASNLFNKEYFDIAGVPLPGTWVKAGLEFNL